MKRGNKNDYGPQYDVVSISDVRELAARRAIDARKGNMMQVTPDCVRATNAVRAVQFTNAVRAVVRVVWFIVWLHVTIFIFICAHTRK